MEVALTSQRPEDLRIDTIVLDAVIREMHTLSAEVTEHPVEGGSKISDHMAKQPDRLELECSVTNTPVKKPPSHADGVTEIGIDIPYYKEGPITIRLGPLGELDPFGKNAFATVKGFSQDFDRVQAVWQELRSIVGKRVVTVVSSLGEYADMGIETVTAPRENAVTKELSFNVTLKQIATATSRTVEAPDIVSSVKAAVPRRNVGKAPPQPVTEQEEDVTTSIVGGFAGL